MPLSLDEAEAAQQTASATYRAAEEAFTEARVGSNGVLHPKYEERRAALEAARLDYKAAEREVKDARKREESEAR